MPARHEDVKQQLARMKATTGGKGRVLLEARTRQSQGNVDPVTQNVAKGDESLHNLDMILKIMEMNARNTRSRRTPKGRLRGLFGGKD
jgi:hypothetical protein